MPFIRVDPEIYDEYVEELGDDLPASVGPRPSGNFEYQAGKDRFEPAELGGIARAAFDALRERGAKAFRVRYDGGYDEGFSQAESVVFADGPRPADDVVAELAAAGFAERVRTAPGREPHYESFFASNPRPEVVAREAVYELAHALASKLLGDGYGTGEYELYGAFTADLITGELADDPTATQPEATAGDEPE